MSEPESWKNSHLIRQFSKLSLRTKLGQDMIWSVFAFGVLGVSGIFLNILIGRFYGPSELGIFTQVFAVWVLISQFSAFGVHISVLTRLSGTDNNRILRGPIVSSALALVTIGATGVCLIAGLLAVPLGNALDSPNTTFGFLLALPGLWMFTINRVQIALLNGVRDMKVLAAVQATRYLLMIVLAAVCAIIQIEGRWLTIVISISEAIVFIFLSFYTLRYYKPMLRRNWEGWWRRHLGFGLRGIFADALTELNSRINLIILGLLLTDAKVGLFVMAAFLVEGFAQLSVVARNNLNPLLASNANANNWTEVNRICRLSVMSYYIGLVGLCLPTMILYPLFIGWFVGNSEFMVSWYPLNIMLCGLLLGGGYLSISQILAVTGHPGTHTLFNVTIIASLITLNLILVPLYGLIGAGIATGGTYIIAAILLKILVKWKLGIKI